MNKLQIRTSMILALSAFVLGACSMESDDDRKIAAGIKCVDEAKSSSDADVCLAKVEGLTSAQSYLIRCSANMVAQGFTGSRLASAFQQLKDNNGNKTTAMMAYLVFSPSITNHTSSITLSNCTASGVASVTFLATMIRTASIAANLGTEFPALGLGSCGAACDPTSGSFNSAALQTQLNNLYAQNNAEANATIGTLAVTAQSTYCATGSTMANQDVCTKLNSAITNGAGNTASIGYSLLNLLRQ